MDNVVYLSLSQPAMRVFLESRIEGYGLDITKTVSSRSLETIMIWRCRNPRALNRSYLLRTVSGSYKCPFPSTSHTQLGETHNILWLSHKKKKHLLPWHTLLLSTQPASLRGSAVADRVGHNRRCVRVCVCLLSCMCVRASTTVWKCVIMYRGSNLPLSLPVPFSDQKPSV